MKSALITGASRGIGRAAALRLAADGYAVAVNYKNSEEKARAVVDEIRSEGGVAMSVCADVSSPSDIERMAEKVLSEFSGVDVLVNNAGISRTGLVTDVTVDEWNIISDTMIRGTFLCTQKILPSMIAKKSGSIINISSIWGICGASCEVAYSTAKAAVIGFTKALSKEVGPSGIRVNCIAPGVIDTDMNRCHSEDVMRELAEETPLGRIGTPEDIANLISFLASAEASFITGQIITADGGLTV